MKAEKIFPRRKGFSLIELFVAMIIIAVFTSFISVNITSQSQTAKSEAERVAAYITGLMRKSDRRHIPFTIKINSGDIKTTWKEASDDFALNPGFSMEAKPKEFAYDSNENEFTPNDKITLTKTLDSSVYYVHIRNGRVRASEVSTDLGENEE